MSKNRFQQLYGTKILKKTDFPVGM